MIIVCDSCGTRFHLADGRVGPKGAKVRCSNCHHSFHVTATPKDAEARPPRGEHSPSKAPPGPVDGETTRARKVLGDPDLDNPKFLFDAGADEAATGGATLPEGVPFASTGTSLSGEVTQMHDALAEEDDKTPPGKRVPTPLMGLDPDVSARQQELTRELTEAPEEPPQGDAWESSESPFDFATQDDYELTPSPGREPSLVSRSEPTPQPEPPARDPDPEPDPDILGSASDDFDEAISRWDAPVAASAPAPAPAVRRVEVLRAGSSPAPHKPAVRPQRFAAEHRAPVTHEPNPAPSCPVEPVPTPLWQQIMAAVVGVALVASGLRASLRQVTPPGPGPLAVQALGWSVEQVRARPSRDAAGDPTIEVEGALRGPKDARLPQLRVTMLDGSGRPMGSGTDARTERPGSFVVTLAEPPTNAHAFRIEIGAAAEPPARPAQATTTASPAPVSPEPPPESVPDSSPAAPES